MLANKRQFTVLSPYWVIKGHISMVSWVRHLNCPKFLESISPWIPDIWFRRSSFMFGTPDPPWNGVSSVFISLIKPSIPLARFIWKLLKLLTFTSETRKLTQSERAPLGACHFDLDLWPFDPKIYRPLPFFILHLCMKYEVCKSNTVRVIALQRSVDRQTERRTDRRTDRRTKWLL